MSYLDLPRFTFFGKFYADPSTVNNDPSHYDPQTTRPSPWQSPNGTHYFKFTSATVTAGMDANGNLLVSGDPLIGAAVQSLDNNPAPAKIVDLDVYQQAVSEIYGLQLSITLPGNAVLGGSVDLCALNSVRFNRVLPTRGWQDWDQYGSSSFGGDTYASGVFQSVLRVPQANWPAASASNLLAALRAATTLDSQGNVLVSIRFVLDSYQNISWHDDFLYGRAVGALGPVLSAAEPLHTSVGRWLNSRALDSKTAPWYWPALYSAPFKVAAGAGGVNTVVIDLANAMDMQQPKGPPVDLGNLTVRFGPSGAPIGPFQANENLYQALGGIIEMPIPAGTNTSQPVQVTTDLAGIGGPALWTEDPTGACFWADSRVFRMTSEPGSAQIQATAQAYVTKWGNPVAGVPLAVEVVPVTNGINGATVPWSAGYQGDTPQANGALQASVSLTDANGMATVTMKVVKDPGSRTSQLDGQLYFLMLYLPPNPPPDLTKAGPVQEQQISVVAWSSYQVDQNPSWATIQAMMEPYVKLYPWMSERIKLDDFHAFQIFATNPPWSAGGHPVYDPHTPYTLPDGKQIAAGAISYFLTRPVTDPRLMPVSRDLSPNKVLTILYYIYGLLQQTGQAAAGGGNQS